MRRWEAGQVLAALASVGGAAVAMASGCGTVDGYDCHELLACDVMNEDGTSNGGCEGSCVPMKLSGFEQGVYLVRVTSGLEDLRCDEAVVLNPRWNEEERKNMTPPLYSELFVAPGAHPGCGPCACSAPACVLPAGLTVSSGWMCDDSPGETLTPFDTPAGWDGACVAPGAVGAEAFGSFRIAPVTARPCEVVTSPVPRDGDAPAGGQVVVTCNALRGDMCPGAAQVCVLGAEEVSPGWRRCLLSEDDKDVGCPSSEGTSGLHFSEQFTFWREVEDRRACTPCSCTETAPSTCEALVSTFEDGACDDLVAAAVVAGNGVCHDAEPGSTLGSVRAEWRVNAPGSCAPSGRELVGELSLSKKVIACCLPEGT
ncbi:hypothetical protein WMF20_03645 [Sorangium sp. So ce834]|uniref:hypothetical protein n=1 Tax=Sorangium sp. So ce834 TaxID=3133321 RepID=UPI003F5DE98B